MLETTIQVALLRSRKLCLTSQTVINESYVADCREIKLRFDITKTVFTLQAVYIAQATLKFKIEARGRLTCVIAEP